MVARSSCRPMRKNEHPDVSFSTEAAINIRTTSIILSLTPSPHMHFWGAQGNSRTKATSKLWVMWPGQVQHLLEDLHKPNPLQLRLINSV